MALVVICGIPAAGKTRVTKALQDILEDTGSVLVVDEPSLHLDRQTSYKDATAEKRTRGQLKAAVDRALSKGRTVILDSLNSIKGYRYEIWCLARAAGLRYCLVHVDTSSNQAQAWNSARLSDGYSDLQFEDLINRFEVPDSKNRWEQPLFRLTPDAQDQTATLQAICNSLKAASGKTVPGLAQAASPLAPTTATTNPAVSHTNLLAELDQATQLVINAISAAQSNSGTTGLPVCVEVPGCGEMITLHRHVTVPEMRRHKRAFIKLLTQNSFARLQSAQQGQQMFVDYILTALNAD